MNSIAESIAALSAKLPGPGKIAQQRSAALAAFRSDGLPKQGQEAWRYTDISELDSANFTFEPQPPGSGKGIDMLDIDADRIVFVNGSVAESISQLEAAAQYGASILGADWASLSDGFPLHGSVIGHPLGQLNTAGAQHGVLLRMPRNTQQAKPLNIVMVHSGSAPLALQPRIVLDLGEQSFARVVLHFLSDESAAGWMNTVIEIRQARGSRLELLQVQEHGAAQTHTSLISADIENDATAEIGCFELGARLARNDIDIRLSGKGSDAKVFGTFLPINAQHIDTQICVDHLAAHTDSTALFRGIAGAGSRGVLNSKVIVRPDAQKISAEQRSDNLLIADDAEIDTKPELEIYADDVKCSHGATVGELDEQHLFYLQSRGIDAAAARALLTNAFAQTIVENIKDTAIATVIADRIAHRLPEHERWELLS